MRVLEIIVVVGVLGLLGMFGWLNLTGQISETRAERDRMRAQRDSLALEAVEERARADGWATKFANDSAQFDSTTNALAEDLRDSGLRVAQLTRLNAVLRDSLRSDGVVVSAPAQDTSGVIMGSWAGEIAEGPLNGSWLFSLPEISLDLSYTVEIGGTLVTTETENRTLVMAQSDDPRVVFDIPAVQVDRVAPRVIQRPPSLWSRFQWFVTGAAAGLVAGRVTP